MVALALFFIVVIGLMLLLIPLLQKVLNDYALTLRSNSRELKEIKINELQQAMNQSLEQRSQELDELIVASKSQTLIDENAIELLQSLQTYLHSIYKVFKSEDNKV